MNIKNLLFAGLITAALVSVVFFVSYYHFNKDCNHTVECVDSLNMSDSILVDSLVVDSISVDSVKTTDSLEEVIK